MKEQLERLVNELVDRGVLYEDARREFERRYIARALEVSGGSLTRAAERLGLHRNTLTRKIADYKLKVKR